MACAHSPHFPCPLSSRADSSIGHLAVLPPEAGHDGLYTCPVPWIGGGASAHTGAPPGRSGGGPCIHLRAEVWVLAGNPLEDRFREKAGGRWSRGWGSTSRALGSEPTWELGGQGGLSQRLGRQEDRGRKAPELPGKSREKVPRRPALPEWRNLLPLHPDHTGGLCRSHVTPPTSEEVAT